MTRRRSRARFHRARTRTVARTARGARTLFLLCLTVGCSDPTGLDSCPDAGAIALEGRNCLLFEDDGRLDAQREAVVEVVRQTLSAVRELLPIEDVTIRIGPGPAFLIPEIGLGGRANGTADVQIMIDPDHPLLERAVSSELFPLLAHELHHIARHRQFGPSANLLEAMVLEGLADHFSIEVAKVDAPIWAVAITGTELEHWVDQAGGVWLNADYDFARWFFGSDPTVPRWTGYAVGFELVDRYLRSHPLARASQLAGEPATAFVPVDSR
jgi:hypothetical protein